LLTLKAGLRFGLSGREPSVLELAAGLNDCFWLFETGAGLDALRERDSKALRKAVPSIFTSQPMASEEALSVFEGELFEVLRDVLPPIENLSKNYNYFKYVSFLAMASVCDAERLYKLYQSLSGDDSETTYVESFLRALGDEPEADIAEDGFRWIERNEDLKLACAWLLSRVDDRFTSEESIVFHSARNPLIMRGDGGAPAMYLRIGLAQAPSDIDRAMHFLRDALVAALSSEHESLDQVPRVSDFKKSKFYREFAARVKPGAKITSLEPGFLRLWIWDLHKRGAKLPFEAAAEEVARLAGIDDADRLINYRKDVLAAVKPGSLDEEIVGREGLVLGPSQGAAKTGDADKRFAARPRGR